MPDPVTSNEMERTVPEHETPLIATIAAGLVLAFGFGLVARRDGLHATFCGWNSSSYPCYVLSHYGARAARRMIGMRKSYEETLLIELSDVARKAAPRVRDPDLRLHVLLMGARYRVWARTAERCRLAAERNHKRSSPT